MARRLVWLSTLPRWSLRVSFVVAVGYAAAIGGCNAILGIDDVTLGKGGGGASSLHCTPPLADCDSVASTGCEVDTSKEVMNCGACEHVCGAAHGSPECIDSSCQFKCEAGYQHCSTDPADDHVGCDVHTDVDVDNCGACSNACATKSGTGTTDCKDGSCTFACTTPFIHCSTSPDSDGCDVNPNTDASHCGGCGISCVGQPNMTGDCVSGVCTCNQGFYDYDGDPSNGCEGGVPTAVSEASKNLVLWLDGDYGFDAGNIWKDQSGHGRHANPWYGTVTTSTLNGRQVIDFNAAELLISTVFPAWDSGATVFAVQNTTMANALITFGVSYNNLACATSAPQGAPNCAHYDMLAFGGVGAIGLEMCDANIGSCFQAIDNPPPSGWVRTVGMLIPNVTPSYRIWWGGVENTSFPTSGSLPFPAPWASPRKDTIIGWNNLGNDTDGYVGSIAEIIVFNTAISDASRTAIDNYLAHKWGI